MKNQEEKKERREPISLRQNFNLSQLRASTSLIKSVTNQKHRQSMKKIPMDRANAYMAGQCEVHKSYQN